MAAPIMMHSADSVSVPYAQIVRYAGILNGDVPENVSSLIDKCSPVMQEALKYKACYLETSVSISEDTVSFEYFDIKSKNLTTLLRGCDKAILVAATAGAAADILVKRAAVTSNAEALILNAIAIAGIEQYMFTLNSFFKEEYSEYELRPRFSPGYGDVELSYQKELLNVLDTKRKIGVALSDTLLMTPSKSVSAIIGIGKDGCIHIDKDCELCNKKDCEYRLG